MDSKGQSLLEVVIMLPFLFLLFGLLFRANMAIQMAINNQQFARSQVYVLTANSPEYPRLGFRHVGIKGGAGRMASGQIDLMLLVVASKETFTLRLLKGSRPNVRVVHTAHSVDVVRIWRSR